MSNFIGGFITGAAVGTTAGVYIKNKLSGEGNKELSLKSQLDEIYLENERFSKRNKEMEREIENLQFENKKLKKSLDEKYDDKDDLESEVNTIKRKVNLLQSQNDNLLLELKEYKTACEGYELEIDRLTNK